MKRSRTPWCGCRNRQLSARVWEARRSITHTCDPRHSSHATSASMNNRYLHGSGKANFFACFENEASVGLWCGDEIAWRRVRIAPRPSPSGSLWCADMSVHRRRNGCSGCSETLLEPRKTRNWPSHRALEQICKEKLPRRDCMRGISPKLFVGGTCHLHYTLASRKQYITPALKCISEPLNFSPAAPLEKSASVD